MPNTDQLMTGELSENDAGAVNASTAGALPISSQPSIKANSQYRMNRLSLKKKSSFRPPRTNDAPLASPSPGSSSARLPTAPEGAAAVQGKQPDPSPVASAAAGARENGGGSAGSKDLKGCNEAGPSTAGNTAIVQQTIPSRRPAALTGMGARFKPPGMLGSAIGHGSNPLPPPGWKPRKKDLASFDMLDDLPDLAAVAPRTEPVAAAAVPKVVEPGAAVEDRPATDPLSEQQPALDKIWQWKPFVPPRPQVRAGAGGSVDVSRAPDSSQTGIACNDPHQATMPETRAQPVLDEAGDADDPLHSHTSVAEPSGNGQETATGVDMDGADRATFRRHAQEATKQGTSHSTLSEAPEQQPQQQRRAWRQSMTGTNDGRPGAFIGSAGATPDAGRPDQATGRGCTGPAGSKRLETPGRAAAVLGPSGLPMQTAGRSTERRRHLKRLYSGNPDDDLIPSAETSRRQGASQDEDDEGLLEDLSFLRGKPSEAGTQPSACTTLLGTSRRTAAAGDFTSIPEPRLSFASRLGRAPGTEQPATSRFHSTAPDSEISSGHQVAPNGGAQPNSGEQPGEANGSADVKLSKAQQRPSSDEHGSQQGPAAGDDGDWHETGATEADEEGPRRRVFKRLCKLSDRPQAGSMGKAAAAGSRSLADWTDDEDSEGDKRFAALPSHAVEQGPKGTNPFARAAKRQAQEPRFANHALPARPAKAAGNHLSTTDIASVLMAPRSSHRERPGSAHKAGSAAAACEEIIDLAADSSDDDVAPVEARASEQPGQQQTKRKGIVQLPPAPDYLLGRPQSLHRPGQQSTAFTPAGGEGRPGGPRMRGDRSYLGAYSAADIAEGKFPGWTSAGDWDAAAVSEAVGSDQGKGKQVVADDDDDGYGGEYHADVAGTSGGWGSGGDDEDPHQEEWEDWGDPGGGAGPSYASPERGQPHLREQDWQQAGVSTEEEVSRRDAEAAYAGAAPSGEAAQEAGPSGRWKGPPWWTRLDDFVPVAAMRSGRDPRDGSVVHIDYSAQFSGAAAGRGSGAAASGWKRGRSSSGRDAPGTSARGRERVDASGTGGHWVTEYERRGPVKVYITATGRKLKGAAAYKASKRDNPGAAVPQELKAKQKRRNGGWRFKKSR